MQTLPLGKRVYAVGDIYGEDEIPWNATFGDRIITDVGIVGETRTFVRPGASEGKRVEVVYVQFDQPGEMNIPDRHTSRWVPRKALCTSRFGHVCNGAKEPCVFCGYQPASDREKETAREAVHQSK